MHNTGESIVFDEMDQRIIGGYGELPHDDARELADYLRDDARQIRQGLGSLVLGERDEAAADAMRKERMADGLGTVLAQHIVAK